MSLDSNLLKEAIADAKAVRQTALANAKVALEEAFSQKYEAMFAQKLKEDADMGEAAPAPQAAGSDVSSQEIDELIKELEQEVGGEPDADDMGAGAPPPAAGAPGAEMPPVDPAGGPGAVPPMAPPMGAPAPGGVCPTCCQPAAPGGVSPVPAVGAPVPQLGAPAPAPMGAEMPPAGAGAEMPPTPPSDVPPQQEDEEINLDELLESLKDEIEGEEKEEVDEAKLASSAIGGKTGGSDNKKPSAAAHNSSGIESGGGKKDGYPSGDAKTTASDPTEASRPNQGANATSTKLSTPSLGGESGPALKAARPNSKGDFENTAKINEDLTRQLTEANEGIKYLKTQLNEVNLMNAKLLYTNKLLKEFAMNNEQKMRIIELFDLSQTVREVKLTYANLAESLNFGGNEHRKTQSTSVQSITEGLASKPVGSTKPSKEIISEGKSAQMVSHFQKLAGIKKSK